MKSKKTSSPPHMSCFELKIMLLMPGLGGRLPKKEKGSSLFVMRPFIFSEALGFSLLSRYVNPTLVITYIVLLFFASLWFLLSMFIFAGCLVHHFMTENKNSLLLKGK